MLCLFLQTFSSLAFLWNMPFVLPSNLSAHSFSMSIFRLLALFSFHIYSVLRQSLPSALLQLLSIGPVFLSSSPSNIAIWITHKYLKYNMSKTSSSLHPRAILPPVSTLTKGAPFHSIAQPLTLHVESVLSHAVLTSIIYLKFFFLFFSTTSTIGHTTLCSLLRYEPPN